MFDQNNHARQHLLMVLSGQSCRVVSFDSVSSRCFIHSRLCPDERLVSARYPGVEGDLLRLRLECILHVGHHFWCQQLQAKVFSRIHGEFFNQSCNTWIPKPKDLQTPADVRPGSMFPLALSAPKTLVLRYLLGSYLGCHICIVTSG